jgi:hypothetical protein
MKSKRKNMQENEDWHTSCNCKYCKWEELSNGLMLTFFGSLMFGAIFLSMGFGVAFALTNVIYIYGRDKK